MKTRIAYYIIVWHGSLIKHEQWILASELHLIATMFKKFKEDGVEHIEVEQHELSTDHWLFS